MPMPKIEKKSNLNLNYIEIQIGALVMSGRCYAKLKEKQNV